MKSLILLLVFCILQVYALKERRSTYSSPQNDQVSAMKEKRTPNTSPVQNIQAISPQDGDNLHLGISAQETPVCKNIAENFVNCMFSSPQFRRHMQQTLCKETEDKLIAKLRTEIVDLNKKLSLMQQREDDNKRKLETIEIETRLRMQEKEKEVNKTLASCRRETFETNKRLQALENLINTTEHRIIETVKHHSGLNFKHIDNAISSNKSNLTLELAEMEIKLSKWAPGRISMYAYTSGCYSTASNSFVWRSTGHPLSYTNWASGYPSTTSDSQCIQIRTENNNWKHYSDSEPFICEFI
ncbi:hypothetical protein B566_EDAN010078 [Ephemera danica]|nr:hypothetical protein B566_EDAN010078 [Ephemera danica]